MTAGGLWPRMGEPLRGSEVFLLPTGGLATPGYSWMTPPGSTLRTLVTLRLCVPRNTEEHNPRLLVDGPIKSSILVISQPSPGNSVKLSARCGFLAQCIIHRGFP
jgi:hypothetical protein